MNNREPSPKSILRKLLYVAAPISISISTASAQTWVEDDTLIERWVLGTASPGGTPPDGWYDTVGGAEFDTKKVGVSWSGDDIIIKIQTNFPEGGIGDEADGIAKGWSNYYGGNSRLYRPADIFLDSNQDGNYDLAFVLGDHGLIPADPRYPDPNFPDRGDPPGHGQSADTFNAGNLYSVSSTFIADDILRYQSSLGGRYDINAPKIAPAWVRHGTDVGDGTINWLLVAGETDLYEATITLTNVNGTGTFDDFNLLWGTATCTNDVIVGTFSAPEPSSVALLGLGSLALMFRRNARR